MQKKDADVDGSFALQYGNFDQRNGRCRLLGARAKGLSALPMRMLSEGADARAWQSDSTCAVRLRVLIWNPRARTTRRYAMHVTAT